MKTTDKPIRIEEVIITSLTVRGNGTTTPFRQVTQVYSRQGDLIAENDPCPADNSGLFYDEAKSLTDYFFENINAFQEDPHRLLRDWKMLNTKAAHESEAIQSGPDTLINYVAKRKFGIKGDSTIGWFSLVPGPRGFEMVFPKDAPLPVMMQARYLSRTEVEEICNGQSLYFIDRFDESQI